MRETSSIQESQDSERGTGNVCIIGAGFTGLAVARALRERNVSFTCVDKSAEVGGLWYYPEDKTGRTPAYDSLHLNTSRDVTGFTEFPMPESYPRYPRHDQVAAYLGNFANHHDLRQHIELNTEVTAVRGCRDETWEVTTRDREGVTTRRFRNVVVASGYQWDPKLPEAISGTDSFSGEFIHSVDYFSPAKYAGKRVLVLGFGNSACDVAVELSRVAKKTLLAFRRGAHVVPKQLMGIPIDEIAASRWWSWLPFRAQRKFIEILLRINRGPITAYGIPEPDHRIFSAPVTISDELLSRISHGEITVRPMIERFDASSVHFADGTAEDVDAVICCTGYHISFPFVPQDSVFFGDGQVSLYQRVVPPRHPGLYFAGLIRPVGALTRLIEQQAEWIADLITGEAAAPSIDEMRAEIHAHLDGVGQRYGTTSIDSIQVDVAAYLRAIRQERKQGRLRRQASAGYQVPDKAPVPEEKPLRSPEHETAAS